MIQLSENVRELQPSATMTIAARAKELKAAGRDVIDLSAGEPDFATPEFIARGGIGAIEQGFTKYTAVAGIPQLRQAIANDVSRRNGRQFTAASIVVGTGAKQALFNACFVLFGPGDNVIIPAPYWTTYPDLVKLSRAEPVFVQGDESDDFKVNERHLDAAYNSAVRGIILNSPSNPSGAVYTRDELQRVVNWALERNLWVISDEIYGRLSYDAPATGILQLDLPSTERIVLVDGASKSYAMTGWRIGFSCTTPELADKLAALQSHITSNSATPSQYAALAAYNADPSQELAVRAMVTLFHKRRDLLVKMMREQLPDVHFVQPSGAFYLFFKIDTANARDSVDFCARLLDTEGVALVPGSAFGADSYVRLSFAASEQSLTEGIQRIARFMKS